MHLGVIAGLSVLGVFSSLVGGSKRSGILDDQRQLIGEKFDAMSKNANDVYRSMRAQINIQKEMNLDNQAYSFNMSGFDSTEGTAGNMRNAVLRNFDEASNVLDQNYNYQLESLETQRRMALASNQEGQISNLLGTVDSISKGIKDYASYSSGVSNNNKLIDALFPKNN